MEALVIIPESAFVLYWFVASSTEFVASPQSLENPFVCHAHIIDVNVDIIMAIRADCFMYF